ncbi:pimeloyl-ACP methyl ester carboxylesterase [Murinocardiopsis flavida]|uniref:Pimeloyl-ACP methyl ester carboxylesterase n=1 Tax=Murinocardiopsis flavida TaxID=645275 RepID=A0A2P8DH43_9ACTN|nr:alpha/beta hydrolase [Murinocardiopsis flavida]PSK96528.1 pimeloyl-ACP methyl ester carboxylesterase [Murinocardiopsis flavida]
MPQTIERDGALSFTVTAGSGDRPVLLVHGFGSNYAMNWEAPGWPWALRAAADRIIGVDVRGHGASAKPHDPASYAPEALVGDLVAVLDAVDAAQVDVVGYSMGARLTWELAVRHPERVRRAVLGGFGPRPLTEDDPDAFVAAIAFAAQLPGNDIEALRACAKGQAAHPFDAAAGVPTAPLLFVAAEGDGLADGVEDLAAGGAGGAGSEVVRLPGRDHRTAVSAQAFKRAAVEFLSG